jgi:hypothetical protein
MLEDGDDPLLLRMSRPGKFPVNKKYKLLADSNFYKSLALFKHRCVYANVVKDLHVPYSTAAISAKNPYLQKIK